MRRLFLFMVMILIAAPVFAVEVDLFTDTDVVENATFNAGTGEWHVNAESYIDLSDRLYGNFTHLAISYSYKELADPFSWWVFWVIIEKEPTAKWTDVFDGPKHVDFMPDALVVSEIEIIGEFDPNVAGETMSIGAMKGTYSE